MYFSFVVAWSCVWDKTGVFFLGPKVCLEHCLDRIAIMLPPAPFAEVYSFHQVPCGGFSALEGSFLHPAL